MEPTAPAPGLARRQTRRLLDRIRPVARRADAVLGKVRVLALVSAGSGLWLWGLLFLPWSVETSGGALFAVLVAVLFVVPGAVLFLFYFGLDGFVRLPERLDAMVGEGEVHAASAYAVTQTPADEGRVPGRLWRLVRSLFDLRGLVLDSKELLLQYAIVVRLFNLWTLAAVVAALALTAVLVTAAALGTLVVLIF